MTTLTSESYRKGKKMANEPYIAQERICATADGVIVDCDAPEAATMVAAKGQEVPQATVDRYKLGKAKRPSRNKAKAGPDADKSADGGDGGEEATEGGDGTD